MREEFSYISKQNKDISNFTLKKSSNLNQALNQIQNIFNIIELIDENKIKLPFIYKKEDEIKEFSELLSGQLLSLRKPSLLPEEKSFLGKTVDFLNIASDVFNEIIIDNEIELLTLIKTDWTEYELMQNKVFRKNKIYLKLLEKQIFLKKQFDKHNDAINKIINDVFVKFKNSFIYYLSETIKNNFEKFDINYNYDLILSNLSKENQNYVINNFNNIDANIKLLKLSELKNQIEELNNAIERITFDLNQIHNNNGVTYVKSIENYEDYFIKLRVQILQEDIIDAKTDNCLNDIWIEKLWEWADACDIEENAFYSLIPDEHVCRFLQTFEKHLLKELLIISDRTEIIKFNIGISRNKNKLLNSKVLDLSNKNLTYIPSELFCLSNLEYLNLNNNPIKILPNNIDKLFNLKVLFCANLNINELPGKIIKLINLKELHLYDKTNTLILSEQQIIWINQLKKSGCVVEIDDDLLNRIKLEKKDIKMNFMSNKFDGVLVDFNNVKSLEVINKKLFLSTNHGKRLLICEYDLEDKAVEDKLFYETVLKNPQVAVVLIESTGLLKAYSKDSDEYKELSMGHNYEIEDNADLDETPDIATNIEIEQSDYGIKLESISNISFEKIRRYCSNLVDNAESDNFSRYFAENAKMHKALMYDTLEQFIGKIDTRRVTLIDWGCGQGIVSSLVIDYIKEKQLDIEVKKVILIDDDIEALNRAMLHVSVLKQNDLEIIAINTNNSDDIKRLNSMKNNFTINLFANDKMPMDYLDIDYDIFEKAYFVCVSSENNEMIKDYYENISDLINVDTIITDREAKVGKFKKFEKIFTQE